MTPNDDIEPAALAHAPRPIRYSTRAASVQYLSLFVLLCYLSVSIWVEARSVKEFEDLSRIGRTTQGTLVDKWENDSHHGVYYTVEYTFKVGESSFDDNEGVSKKIYDDSAVAAGSSVTVTYLPGRPQVHCLGIVNADRVFWQGAVLPGKLVVIAAALPIVLLVRSYKYRKLGRLLSQGLAAVGHIEERETVAGVSETGRSLPWYDKHYIRYRFDPAQYALVRNRVWYLSPSTKAFAGSTS